MREDISIGLAVIALFFVLSGYRPRLGLLMLGIAILYFVALRFYFMPKAGKWWFARMYKTLQSPGFGVDAEITAKVARGGFRIFEVPVSYFGRSQAEGKKIRLKDGFSALASLARHSFGPSRPKQGRP